jgi:hypothetical protein
MTSQTQKPLKYVLQPHAISRAMYRLSITARKVIAVGMAQLSPDLSCRIAEFSATEFFEALDLRDGGTQYQLLQNAVRECMGCTITLETPNGWEMFTWITHAVYNKKTGKIILEFSKSLTDYIIELRKMYARIDLVDIGKLQSFYAYRYFELAKSYESLTGKEGNKKGQWYFTRTIPELRQILVVYIRPYVGVYPSLCNRVCTIGVWGQNYIELKRITPAFLIFS